MLRDLLCPPAYASLRKVLLAHTSSGSGSGYQLASYPLIWVDADALAWNVEQAIRMERFGDDPLPFWQRAYELAKRGEYLPDEVYSEWADFRREEIAGMRRQSVLALARLYTEQHSKAGEEEALRLLRSYWTEHPREEDVLRPLMELLGWRDRYQEALAYYEKLCAVLEEEGQQPDPHTRDVAEYVRTKQVQRPSLVRRRVTQGPLPLLLSSSTPVDKSRILQDESLFHLTEIQEMDTSRRALLHNALGMAGTAFLPSAAALLDRLSYVLAKPSTLDETTLLALEQRVQDCWRIRPDIAGIVSPHLLKTVLEHLQHVASLLAGSLPPSTRIRLCALVCQLTQIAGWTLYEMRAFSQAQAYYEVALRAAHEAESVLLEAVTLVRMSRLLKYCAQEERILPTLQYAHHLLDHAGTSPTRSWIAAEKALAFAREKQASESLKLLEQVTSVSSPLEFESDPYRIGFEENVRFGFFGSCYAELQQLQDAEAAYREAIAQIHSSSRIHPAHRRSLLSVNLATIFVRQKAVEQACQLSHEALTLVQHSHSPLVLQHLLKFRRELGPWKALDAVKAFDHALTEVQESVFPQVIPTDSERSTPS